MTILPKHSSDYKKSIFLLSGSIVQTQTHVGISILHLLKGNLLISSNLKDRMCGKLTAHPNESHL